MKLSIGSKIKDCRLKLNISQTELCGEFISRPILSKIENNKMLPSIPQLEYIAGKLKIPAAYFFIAEDPTQFIEKNSFTPAGMVDEMFNKEDYQGIIKLVEFEDISANKSDFILYYYVGMSFFNLGMYKDAVKSLNRYLKVFIKSTDNIQKDQVINFAIASNTLFKINISSGDLNKCKAYLMTAKKYLYLYDKNISFINFAINSNLAFIYNELNDYESTIELLEFFLSSNKTLIYMDIIPDLHLSLNIAYYNIGEYEKSIDHIKKSIFFYSYIGNKFKEESCYLNYINALRYDGNFLEALRMADSNIINCCFNKLYNQFLTQKAIIYFNTGNYEACLNQFDSTEIPELLTQSKNNYYFMRGHIEFLNKNYDNALKYLSKCERYFEDQHYYKDLVYLNEDLFHITKDEKFKNAALKNKTLMGRRNIY